MSNTYSLDSSDKLQGTNPTYITHADKEVERRIAAMQAAVFTHLGASADGMNLPFDPSENNPESDVQVVYRSDGTVDVLATMEKLENMLYYAAYGDPSNTNIISDITALLANISGVWGSLSASDQELLNNFMGAAPTAGDGQTTLGYELVQWINRAFFYQDGGNEAKALQDAQTLAHQLDALGGRCSWMDNLIAADDADVNGNFQNWMKTHHSTPTGTTGTDMSLQEFTFWQGLEWEQYLIQATGSWFHQARTDELNELYEMAGKNASFLFVLLMIFMTHDNDQMQMQMTGKANTNTLLTTTGGDLNKIITQFKNMNGPTPFAPGGVTNKEAKSFFDGFMDFAYRMKDSRLASLYPQVQQVANYIDGHNGQGLITTAAITVGSTTYPAGTSFGDIYSDCQGSGDYTALAQAFNQIMPGGGSGGVPVVPQGWTDVTNDMQQLATTIPSQSQGVSVQEQTLQGTSDKENAMINAGFSMVMDLVKFIMQMIQSSASA